MSTEHTYRQFQRLLSRAGYSCTIDGRPTDQFYRSLRTFKRNVRLPVTDTLDTQTLATLKHQTGESS